mmetsp:Transcript_8109/g.24289  ORF Transcript_8109/g.24289 Transcript_8109/m.24289 type:complete len:230 (+) Transcript_8109:339-1028(+)
MKSITRDDSIRRLSLSSMDSGFTSAASSPLSLISCMMSYPPNSSPLTYSCGYVGQFEYSLSPCLTSWSVRMSKCPNSAPASCRSLTAFLLNPHLGSSGLPFMNNTTGFEVVSLCNLALSSRLASSWSCWGEGSGASAGLCKATLSKSPLGSAPSRVSTTLPCLRKTMCGTIETSNFSVTPSSSSLSASTLRSFTLGCLGSLAIKRTASSICLHGSHHSAQKWTTTRPVA